MIVGGRHGRESGKKVNLALGFENVDIARTKRKDAKQQRRKGAIEPLIAADGFIKIIFFQKC